MATFDRRFVRPSGYQLMEAFTAAARAANGDWNILPVDEEHWRDVVAGLPKGGDGHRRWGSETWRNTHAVRLWWWTDRHGGRHCRVRGDERSPDQPDPRPPFWHIYPDRTFYRAPAGFRPAWWVVCPCGTAGEPLAVGWTGAMCAACHDRQQEGEPAPVTLPLPTFLPREIWGDGPDVPMAFSPDGRQLAAAFLTRSGPYLRVTDLDTGDHRILGEGLKGSRALAFSPDARLLAHTGGPSRLCITDLETGALPLDQATPSFELTCLAFAPHGLALAAGGPDGARVWERTHRQGAWELRHTIAHPVCALTFSPGSELLALGGSGALRLYDLPGTALVSQPLLTFPSAHAAYQLAFAPEPDTSGRLTALVGPHGLGADVWRRQHGNRANAPDELSRPSGPSEAVVLRLHGQQAETALRRALPHASWGVVCPEGRWLAWSCADFHAQQEVVHLTDLHAGEVRGQVAWDRTSSPGGLALSCFETGLLAITDGGGRLIPWRLLLGL